MLRCFQCLLPDNISVILYSVWRFMLIIRLRGCDCHTEKYRRVKWFSKVLAGISKRLWPQQQWLLLDWKRTALPIDERLMRLLTERGAAAKQWPRADRKRRSSGKSRRLVFHQLRLLLSRQRTRRLRSVSGGAIQRQRNERNDLSRWSEVFDLRQGPRRRPGHQLRRSVRVRLVVRKVGARVHIVGNLRNVESQRQFDVLLLVSVESNAGHAKQDDNDV